MRFDKRQKNCDASCWRFLIAAMATPGGRVAIQFLHRLHQLAIQSHEHRTRHEHRTVVN